jgi:hypothetical protein
MSCDRHGFPPIACPNDGWRRAIQDTDRESPVADAGLPMLAAAEGQVSTLISAPLSFGL